MLFPKSILDIRQWKERCTHHRIPLTTDSLPHTTTTPLHLLTKDACILVPGFENLCPRDIIGPRSDCHPNLRSGPGTCMLRVLEFSTVRLDLVLLQVLLSKEEERIESQPELL